MKAKACVYNLKDTDVYIESGLSNHCDKIVCIYMDLPRSNWMVHDLECLTRHLGIEQPRDSNGRLRMPFDENNGQIVR